MFGINNNNNKLILILRISMKYSVGYAHGAGVQSNMTLSHDFICLYHHSYLR